ncbi:glycoside hydrolase family 38 C-terminal domain-containing protein [Mucilaginibacter sp. dw_454]|uniref:glycoside hydrolase family 38 N-terminal domain-containing protein n=1 Tax=Mucilaginibacter sp. dw_454 TaxID=2720079 RepID=UPI001BD56AB0|nr:glycoside hydrolase family 38 C-terminal domain-containing protein [Mucilaginibacter sp. dw_454]
MKKLSALALTFVCLAATVCAQQQPVKHFTGITLQPTVAYLKTADGNKRMARLVFNSKNFSQGEVEVKFNGQTTHVKIPANKDGIDAFEIALPGAPVTKPIEATVTLKADDKTYTAVATVNPCRADWKVYVLPHSHVDIGYTNVQEKVLRLHMDNIDESIDLAKKTADYPKEAQYKWTTEAMWVVDNYLKRADAAKRDRFWDAVKKGWISLDGAYGNTNTSMTDSKQLMEMFAKSQQLAKAHGLTINTMFQGDVPGASWGLSAQVEQTNIKYFLSGPNASDRIGNLAKWQDKPFYWMSPSGKQQLLFWQCQPYSIGYALKGDKIPNFFSVEDPKPYYTGHPTENFLNPYLFGYLGGLEKTNFPYDMTILTWAMSDNAPIDPELPEAVKLWNERYASPKLIITSTKQFFGDFEAAYKDKIPHIKGDYTEYWTDGVSTAAKETALSRETSDQLKQADAIWAIRNKAAYPASIVDETWKNLLLYNEHTWGAYNSTSEPENEKVLSEWAVKKNYAIHAKGLTDTLTAKVLAVTSAKANGVDIYNTLSWPRTDVVYVAAELSKAGDLVKDVMGKPVPSQRLSTGELAFVATGVPAFGKKTYTVSAGKAFAAGFARISESGLSNGVYAIKIDPQTGDIDHIVKTQADKDLILVDSAGFNQYTYMPGDSLQKIESTSGATISIKENGPLVVSLSVTSKAPGANGLTREIRLVSSLDKVELINTIDKRAIRRKESVHFAFPFKVPGAQVRYSIPWGSAEAEKDQLQNANRNWYTMQRWVDISNAGFGVTWSSPDAPLFEIGKITTADLLGGLHHAPQWITYTPQSSQIFSWVMNNLWHTNFRVEQEEGPATFRYIFSAHASAFNSFKTEQTGLANHQPLIAAAASADAGKLFFKLSGNNVYVEAIKPADDGKGVVAQLVNAGSVDAHVSITPQTVPAVKIWQSNLTEDKKAVLANSFVIPAKGMMTVRVER